MDGIVGRHTQARSQGGSGGHNPPPPPNEIDSGLRSRPLCARVLCHQAQSGPDS